jgi:tartrate dehydratase beta subunit/fumarate hydratase class I family protein
MDILSENSKKEYPKAVTELIRVEGKIICARHLLLHKKILNLLKKEKEVNVQIMNSILLELS